MGLELATIATLGSLASTAVGGIASYQQAQSQADCYERQAAANAATAREKNRIQKMQLRRDQTEQMGESIVSGATSGAGLQNFSDLHQDDLEQKALDMAIMDYNSELEVNSINTTGQMRAENARASGKAKLFSSLVSAGSGVAGSGAFGGGGGVPTPGRKPPVPASYGGAQ